MHILLLATKRWMLINTTHNASSQQHAYYYISMMELSPTLSILLQTLKFLLGAGTKGNRGKINY